MGCRLDLRSYAWPDVAFQRHDDFFANRVDGRVSDLGKPLFEVVVKHSGFF